MTNPQTLFNGNTRVIVEEEINIKDIIDKYFFHFWYLYLFFITLGIGLAYTYLKYSTPVYKVKSSLLIKEDKSDSFAPGDKLLKDLNLFGASENVSNEIQIISSMSIMEQVVKDLNLAVQFSYKDWIKDIPAYNDFPILLDSFILSPMSLTANHYQEGGINFQIKPIDYQRFELINEEGLIGTYQFEEVIHNEFGLFKFLIKPHINFASDSLLYVSIKSTESVALSYLNNLEIELVDIEATIIQLQLNETLPERGLAILNHLTQIYNDQTIEDKNKITRNSLKFINERLESITEELTVVEGNVERYKKKNEITSESAGDLNIVMQEMSKFTEEQTNLEVQLSILGSMGSFLGSPNEFELIPSNLSVANPALISSVASYNQLVLSRQKLLETAQPSNPIIITTEQQLKSLKSIIRTTK